MSEICCVYLLSDGACQHERRNFKLRKPEVEGVCVLLAHDVHVDQVLHVVLVEGHQKLFLRNIKRSSNKISNHS